VGTDNTGKRIEEIDSDGGDKIRLTLVDPGWSGTQCVRIQVRDERGHLRQGPEIPLSQLGELISAAFRLVLTESSNGD